MVTMRSSSSELSSPALSRCEWTLTTDERNAPLVQVDVRLFADNVGVPPANALDLRQRVHDLALAVDIGVEQTQNVLSDYQ